VAVRVRRPVGRVRRVAHALVVWVLETIRHVRNQTTFTNAGNKPERLWIQDGEVSCELWGDLGDIEKVLTPSFKTYCTDSFKINGLSRRSL
jgi:hypothetical protein